MLKQSVTIPSSLAQILLLEDDRFRCEACISGIRVLWPGLADFKFGLLEVFLFLFLLFGRGAHAELPVV